MNTTAAAQATPSVYAYTQQACDATHHAFFHAIFSRSDMRGRFLHTPVTDELPSRILTAAHTPHWV